MKSLYKRPPTPEQLAIISEPRDGVKIIRGAAGSGKTTTALLMLRQLSRFWVSRKTRLHIAGCVRALVLTYNRTLKGYIADLAQGEAQSEPGLELCVSTFAKFTRDIYDTYQVLDVERSQREIKRLSQHIPLPGDFVVDEVDYLLGRFLPDDLAAYLDCKRDGRGSAPRVDKDLRRKLLDEVVSPYSNWKDSTGVVDWNDLALLLAQEPQDVQYDIIIVDETQDMSANQIRAIMNCAAKPSSVVFVMDAAQRIYPRGFTWKEVGILNPKTYTLRQNHRNTAQICALASPLLDGMSIGDDGALPDLKSCSRSGPVPLVLKGKYNKQIAYVLEYIKSYIDLSKESVAFLKPHGGQWFDCLKAALEREALPYVEITRAGEWPTGTENIALSTMHSAKGLEFDHVFILGLNDETTPHGEEPGDSALENLRRILAVAITRARELVIIGYKPENASRLIGLLKAGTFREITL